MGVDKKLQAAAVELVDRSRNGDQNATAMILEIRRAALEGVPRAQVGYELLKKIVQAKPASAPLQFDFECQSGSCTNPTEIAGEAYDALELLATRGPIIAIAALIALPDMGGERGVTAGAVLLANGPRPITKRLVSDIGAGIDETHYRRLFFYGVNYCGRPALQLAHELQDDEAAPSFLHAGRCVGIARSIQRVRLPGSVISQFNRLAGWELGE